MFKDIYKSANDSIDTSEAFERISTKIYKTKPTKIYRPYFGAVAVAACALIVCTVFFKFSFNTNTTENIHIAKKSTPKTVIGNTADSKKDNFELQTSNPSRPAESEEKNITEEKNVSAVKIQPVKPVENIQNRNIPSNVPSPVPTEVPDTKAPLYIVLNVNRAAAKNHTARAGGAYTYKFSEHSEDTVPAAEAAFTLDDTQIPVETENTISDTPKELSYDEYCLYMGCDIKSRIINFTDISSDFSGIYQNCDGTVPYDEYTFSFENGNEYLNITVTKQLSSISDFLDSPEYQKSIFGEIEAVIIQDENILNAYFIKNGTAYTIMLTDSSDTTLKNIITSLIQ